MPLWFTHVHPMAVYKASVHFSIHVLGFHFPHEIINVDIAIGVHNLQILELLAVKV